MTEGEVSAMRRKYEQARERNRQLQTEINALCNSVSHSGNAAISSGNSVLQTLSRGTAMLSKDDYTLHDVDKVREDIKEKFTLYKNIETAYKNIRGFQEELRSQQGCEQKVRRIVIAILDNEEKAMVSDETLLSQASKIYQDVIAQQFFLTYIMMDLVHQKSGEREASLRARQRAVAMDERMSAWVYFLISLKRGDGEEQSKWLDVLMKESLTGTERENLRFLTMMALKGEDEISKRIASYIGLMGIGEIDRKDVAESILKNYHAAMTVNPPDFQYLRKYTAEYGDLMYSLRGALNNESVGGYVQQIAKKNGDKIGRGFLTVVLDRVVDDCHSPRAKEILKQIEINQNVITAKGNMQEAAALKVKEEIVAVSDIKLENCLYDWLNENTAYSGKDDIVGFAYGKLKPSYVRAYHSYIAEYRGKMKKRLHVNFGEYQTESDLSSASEETVKMEKMFRARCEEQKKAIKDLPSTLMLIFGAILLVAGIVLNFVVNSGFGTFLLVAGVLGGLFLIIFGVHKRFRNYRARLDADKKCEDDIVACAELIKNLVSDMTSFRAMYQEADAKILQDSFFDIK